MNMKLAAKIMGKVGLVGFIGFVATFTIYMFNLENKLSYLSLIHIWVRRSTSAMLRSSALSTSSMPTA